MKNTAAKFEKGVGKTGLFNRAKHNAGPGRIQLLMERGNGFYSWDGKLYHSDIVRACIRPLIKAVGKLDGKHVRRAPEGKSGGIAVNPDAYIRFLLEEPNPYMTGQVLQEKLAAQLCLNNNAFALIVRDDMGYPCGVYPIPACAVEAVYGVGGELFLRFYLPNGQIPTFPYGDIIHLRDDFNDNDIFGEPPAPALSQLMEIVSTTDQGIIKAVRNSAVVKWLLRLPGNNRPEEVKNYAREFAENYISIDSDSMGVAATDSKAEVIRIEPRDYVPNAAQTDRTVQRIYSFFNTNERIVQSRYTEDEFNAYFESRVEPVAIQLSGEYTRKLFTRRERGCGNRIIFEASNLQYASMATKLGLVQFVDRGMMTPNEVRAIFNYAPIDGGDQPVRRLDTAPVGGGEQRNESRNQGDNSSG